MWLHIQAPRKAKRKLGPCCISDARIYPYVLPPLAPRHSPEPEVAAQDGHELPPHSEFHGESTNTWKRQDSTHGEKGGRKRGSGDIGGDQNERGARRDRLASGREGGGKGEGKGDRGLGRHHVLAGGVQQERTSGLALDDNR